MFNKASLLLWHILSMATAMTAISQYDLPVFASSEPAAALSVISSHIPRHIWISMKEVPLELPSHIQMLIDREKMHNWTIHIEDNKAQLEFMTKYYANTSTLWAFRAINERIGNAASDIWRYSLLYYYGGVYLDDDAKLDASFDYILSTNESIILTKESNKYVNPCYKDKFHLSDEFLIRKYQSTTKVTDVNGGHTLASWGIISSPRHPFIRRTLENIVELIKYEYLRKTYLKLQYFDMKWMVVMCITGPLVLTASVKEVILENYDNKRSLNYRIENRDFASYGGNYKVSRKQAGTSHYMHSMVYLNTQILREYTRPLLSELNNRLITTEKNKPSDFNYFMLINGTVTQFRDMKHIMRYGFTERNVFVMERQWYKSIPKSKQFLDENGGLSIADVEGKLISVINRRNMRRYYVIENGTSHSFLDWDHFSSFNFSTENTFVVSDHFMNSIPIGSMYRLNMTLALDKRLVHIIIRGSKRDTFVFYRVRDGRLCSFNDTDHIVSFGNNVDHSIQISPEFVKSIPSDGPCKR